MDNPDNALPLYLLVVITGILLGPGWRPFLAAITTASQTAADTTTAGSAAVTGGQHG